MNEAFAEVATVHEAWVRALARTHACAAATEDLLYAAGMEALWQCTQTFDARRGASLQSFAYLRVRGAMRDAREREMRFWRISATAAYGSVHALEAPEPSGEPALEWLASPDPGPMETTERARDQKRLAEEITQLPERWQQALDLYYCEGLTQAEIGRVLEVSQVRAGQILHEAVGLLRQRLHADNAMML